MSRRHATVALVGAWVAFFARQLFADVVPFRRDMLQLYLPIRYFIHESARAGRLPQWYPYEGLGVPFIGQIVTGLFHPLTWLLLPLDPGVALKFHVLLAYLIALTGGYRFARVLGGSRIGALCGATALAFSGYALSMSDNLPFLMGVATLPWVGWAAAHVAKQSDWTRAAVLAITLGLLILGGDVQSFAFSPVLIAATLIAARGGFRAFYWSAFAINLGVALSAIELAPATTLYVDSARRNSGYIFDVGTYWALHPSRLVELIIPHALQAGRHLWAQSIFAGSVALVLALAGMRLRRASIAFGALALAALWMSTGSILHAPVVSAFRFPEKYLVFFEVALVPLAAFGADRLMSVSTLHRVALLLPAFLVAELWLANRDLAPMIARSQIRSEPPVAALTRTPNGPPPRIVAAAGVPADEGGIFDVAVIGVSEFPMQSQLTRDVIGPLGARASELGPSLGACNYAGCPPQARLESAGEVQWNGWQPGDVTLSEQSPSPSELTVNEAYARGWAATVNGAATPIHVANGIAMGLEVPAGTSAVHLHYDTPRLLLGAIISALALISCALLISFGGAASRRELRLEATRSPLPREHSRSIDASA